MSVTAKEYKRTFLASKEAESIRAELESMTVDPRYNTRTFYTPLDDSVSFVEKHLGYLGDHPKLKASEYLSNLRLMTRNRG